MWRQSIVWLSLWFTAIFYVQTQNVTTEETPGEIYCPPDCRCGEGSNLPLTFGARVRYIYCIWTDSKVNFTEEITLATTNNQSISFDIHIKCYGNTEIVWTSSNFLQKTFSYRMFNCTIINDSPVLFPFISPIRFFILDTMRPIDIDKLQFQAFQSADIFQISYSNLTRVPNLHRMPYLTILNLEGNDIDKIPCDLFYKRICLMCLVDFSFNSISSIPDCPTLAVTSFGLPTYVLTRNKLKDIRHIGHLDMTRVDLSYNQIKFLPNFTNTNLFNLTVSHNFIKEINRSSFPSIIFLRYLDLSFNQIERIEIASFSNLFNLKKLSLQGNNLVVFDEAHTPPISLTVISIDIQYNRLEYPPFQNGRLPAKQLVEIKSGSNPYVCDCKMADLLNTTLSSKVFIDKEMMVCQTPARLQNKTIIKLDLESSCPVVNTCPVDCECDYNKSIDITDIKCSQRSLSELPLNMPEGKLSINLSENNIQIVDKREYFSRTVYLDLRWNDITNITTTALTLLSNIHSLYLNNNNITTLPRSIIDVQFTPQTSIYLASNPWYCSCDLLWFPQWLREENSSITDKHKLQCHSISPSRQVIDITADILQCDTNLKSNLSYIIVAVMIFIIMVIIIILICKFRYEIRVLLYTRLHVKYFAPSNKDLENKKAKDYDVYLVYSEEELAWTRNNLLNRLENIENPVYKTIISDRDFLVGETLDENISNAISNSYCSLFVFSKYFINNEWCLYNFHCAYEHMLKHKDMVIVIIIKEEFEIDQLNDDLKAYFKSHTYLEFQDKIFWDKLLYVLPKPKSCHEVTKQCIV